MEDCRGSSVGNRTARVVGPHDGVPKRKNILREGDHAAVLADNGRTGLPPFQEVQLSRSGPNVIPLRITSEHTVSQTSQKR